MAMPLTEPYSADLADPTSAAHIALSAQVVDQTMAAVQQSAATYSCDAHVNGVTFAPLVEGRRRRSDGVYTTATVDMTFTTTGDQTESGDLAANVSGDVSSNVQAAITSGAIALVDPNATVDVAAARTGIISYMTQMVPYYRAGEIRSKVSILFFRLSLEVTHAVYESSYRFN